MKKRTPIIKLTCLLGIVGLPIALVLNGGSKNLATDDQSHNERPTITLMYPIYTGKADSPELTAFIENKLNINLEFIQVASSSYNNRARVALSKPSGPDALVWTAFPQAELFNYASTGQLHRLDEYLEQYPSLQNIPAFIWDNGRINGSLYGIPRPRASVDQAVFIRKDWLDNLQLPIPSSLDDYTRISTRFAIDDPDRNGKKDTFGFAASKNLGSVWEMSYAFDSGQIWKETFDGTLLHSHLTEGRELALKWLKQLYASGGLDPRYNEWNTDQMFERFISGYTGIMISQISNFYHLKQKLYNENPEAQMIMLPPPVGPSGVSGFAERSGFYGQIVIPSRVSAEKVERILALLDWMSSEEGDHMRKYGLEGIHHIVQENSSLHVDHERMEKEGIESFFFMNRYDPYFYVTPHAPPDIQRQQHEMLDQVRTLGIANPAAAFMPSVQYRTGNVYSSEINNYFDDYVTGRVSEDSLEQFRSDWLDRGGRLAMEEVNAWYQQSLTEK